MRFGLVSDIDDTVITTMLPRPMIAAFNTFVRRGKARRAVPGIAPMYRRLRRSPPRRADRLRVDGGVEHAATLNRFLLENGFPLGPLMLTDWGPTNTGWFRSGQDHKRTCLHRLARDFPDIRWLLVGDDGQHDPQLYAEFAEARPDRVDAICIRHLSPTEQVLSNLMKIDAPARTMGPRTVPTYSATGRPRPAPHARGAGTRRSAGGPARAALTPRARARPTDAAGCQTGPA